MKGYVLIALACLCLLLFGCRDEGGGDSGSGGPEKLFKTTLKLKGQNGNETTLFSQGEPVIFELSITNITGSPQNITLSSSQIYEFIVAQASDLQPLWHWSYGKMFAMAIQELSFAAGETKTYQETWDQINDAGNLVATGDYAAQGFMWTTADAANRSINDETETRSARVNFSIN